MSSSNSLTSSSSTPSVSASRSKGGDNPRARLITGAVIATVTALAAIGLSYYFSRRSANEDEAAGHRTIDTNTALLFIKPHAQNPKVHDFLQKELHAKGLRVVRQGQIRGDSIAEKGTIDSHYAAIGLYAMKFPPKDLQSLLTPERSQAFLDKYGISFEDAVAQGKLMNAAECMRRYGWNASKVSAEFEKAKALTMFKIAPGCYTARLDNGAIVVNGFYLQMRAEYVHRDAVVTWVVVQWKQKDLSWAAFRGNVLGATDPTKASHQSIRYKMMTKAHSLGLDFTPTMATNCVHGSASPLEALNERLVWTGVGRVDNDTYGKYLLSRGLSEDTLHKMLGNAKVDGVPIFDLVEDMDSNKCADKLLELAAKL